MRFDGLQTPGFRRTLGLGFRALLTEVGDWGVVLIKVKREETVSLVQVCSHRAQRASLESNSDATPAGDRSSTLAARVNAGWPSPRLPRTWPRSSPGARRGRRAVRHNQAGGRSLRQPGRPAGLRSQIPTLRCPISGRPPFDNRYLTWLSSEALNSVR